MFNQWQLSNGNEGDVATATTLHQPQQQLHFGTDRHVSFEPGSKVHRQLRYRRRTRHSNDSNNNKDNNNHSDHNTTDRTRQALAQTKKQWEEAKGKNKQEKSDKGRTSSSRRTRMPQTLLGHIVGAYDGGEKAFFSQLQATVDLVVKLRYATTRYASSFSSSPSQPSPSASPSQHHHYRQQQRQQQRLAREVRQLRKLVTQNLASLGLGDLEDEEEQEEGMGPTDGLVVRLVNLLKADL
ncbi:hypothetical protein F4859DRAFT_495707 [Xylaria cf. heliscus]|nr:hypothetical protein F4859DRAFT_495707 [Xylaria cf. heliscus]